MSSYLLLSGGWVMFYFLHSWLALASVKKKISLRHYRLFYSIFFALAFIALIFLNYHIEATYFWQRSIVLRLAGIFIVLTGFILIWLSFKSYSFKSYFGLLAEEPHELCENGFLKYVRHPLYSGTILVFLGFFLSHPNLPTLITVLSAFVYLPIGIYFEEKKLINNFGDAYIHYRKRVPALIPRLKKSSQQ